MIGSPVDEISTIERGDLENTRIGTVRRYLKAVGGELSIEYVTGDARVHVA